MKKIVIAADSFKGSISSKDFADVCEQAIRHVLPNCKVVKLPLGDGGEGTAEALTVALGGDEVSVRTHDPLMRARVANYGISADGETAIMEMAQASGLTLLTENERNPMLTTTFGTGEMIADALQHGCRKILIGIGGSATNDGGLGMLLALGAKAYDSEGNQLIIDGCGKDLQQVATLDLSPVKKLINENRIIVACDVDNHFFGSNGAAKIFAHQKGADEEMISLLDIAMCRFATVLSAASGVDVGSLRGAGAAGGIGGALAAIGAHLMPGIEMVLEAINFNRQITNADLVITGEGRIDSQTLMGKTPYGVLCAAKKQNVPAIALAGSVEYSPELSEAGFAGIFSIQPSPCTLSEAMNPEITERNLYNTVVQLITLINNLRQ